MARYLKIYNDHIPQRNIGHLTPIQKLKEGYKKKPELFKKNVSGLPGLDTSHCVTKWEFGNATNIYNLLI